MIDKKIFDLGLPILGICYGMQLITYLNNGIVSPCNKKEYGGKDCRNVLKDFQEKELVADSSILISQVHSIKRSSLRCAINSHIKQNVELPSTVYITTS